MQTDESSPKVSNDQTFNDSSNYDAPQQMDGLALTIQTAKKENTESSNITDSHQNTEESSRNNNQLTELSSSQQFEELANVPVEQKTLDPEADQKNMKQQENLIQLENQVELIEKEV